MKLNLNKPLSELEIISKYIDIPEIKLPSYHRIRKGFKTYNFIDGFDNVNFEKFMLIAKYSCDLQHCSRFISEISGIKQDIIKKMPIKKIIGLYFCYETEFKKIIKFFSDQKELIQSEEKPVLYDFSEFGLKQIIYFLSGGSKIEEDNYMKTNIYTVMRNYRFKIIQVENNNFLNKTTV